MQLLYLDGKVLLYQKLVLSFLDVTCICHEMLKWKQRELYFEIFRGYNVFANDFNTSDSLRVRQMVDIVMIFVGIKSVRFNGIL